MPKNWQRKTKKNAPTSATAEPEEQQPSAIRITCNQDSERISFMKITDNMTVTDSNGERVSTGPYNEMMDMMRSAYAMSAAHENSGAGTTTPHEHGTV